MGTILTGSDVAAARDPVQVFDTNVAAGGRPIPGVFALRAREGTTRDQLSALARARGCAVKRQLGRAPIFLLRCAPALDPSSTLRSWLAAAEVTWIEADFLDDDGEATEFPPEGPDDLTEAQWHHRNLGQTVDEVAGVPGADIGSLLAWSVTVGAPGVVVAILDTGIDAQHEDLQGQLWTDPQEAGAACADGLDNDGDGWTDECAGWDAGDSDADPSPHKLPLLKANGDTCKRHHATFMAGLVAAAGDNALGVVGAASGARVMNLKRLRTESCQGSSLRSLEGVAFARHHGARVIVMSFSSTTYSALLEEELQHAEADGVLLVMSAGNDSGDVDDLSQARFPNHYDLQHHLIVANSTNTDELSSKSNYGATLVDLMAPGSDVTSTTFDPVELYEQRSGTSYSAPLVASAGALLWSAFPELDLAEVADSITAGVQPLPSVDCAASAACVRTGGRLWLPGALAEGRKRALGLTVHRAESACDAGGACELFVTVRPARPVYMPSSLAGALRIDDDRAGLTVTSGASSMSAAGESIVNDVAFTVTADAPCRDREVAASLQLSFEGTSQTLDFAFQVECPEPRAEPPLDRPPDGAPDEGPAAGDERAAGCAGGAPRDRSPLMWLLIPLVARLRGGRPA